MTMPQPSGCGIVFLFFGPIAIPIVKYITIQYREQKIFLKDVIISK
jgi:hypothetical protein